MKLKKSKKNSPEELGRMLINIYESGYIDRNQMYKTSFLKGMITGLGGVIGATIVVGALLWGLSLFEDVPVLGRLVDRLQNSVQTTEQ